MQVVNLIRKCRVVFIVFQGLLERYFPEYTVGAHINKTAKYILWRFMQANRARLSIYLQ